MNMTPVTSSLIESIGFENNEMRIAFHKGKTYSYTGPLVQAHYNALLAAPSVGKHFLAHVKRCPHTSCTVVPALADNQPVEQS